MVNHPKYPIFTYDLYLAHKMLPSTFYITSPMHLQSLKLLCPTVKEEMHLQENTLYDLAQYSPHHVIYAPAKFEVAKSNHLGEEAFTRKYII